ncbi:MAG: cysteine desulfurase [Candidatus Pacebacteria bacterium]|nr:cysteine desulfurase [Candidatus Paceibacterota bacterium]
MKQVEDIIKKDFPIFTHHPELVYLDNAATSQTPRVILEKMNDYYERYRANIHRGLYSTALTASAEYDNARQTVADFIGAQSEEVIFTSGATNSMNKLVAMLEHSDYFQDGDEIVTTVMEHHAVLVPLLELAKRRGLSIKYASLKPDHTLDEEAMLALITNKTKLVAISMASNVLGTMPEVARVCERAREAGALCVVDAAKAAGHFPISVTALGCDFLFFSGHKMYGPTGVGVLFGRSRALASLAPGSYGGGIIRSVNKCNATYLDAPERFEAGTPPIAEAIGLAEAIRYIDTIGLSAIHQHITQLVEKTITVLSEIEEVTVYAAPATHNAGVVSFAVADIHPHDIAEVLGRENVAVRAGHHCAEPLMNELGVKSLTRASFSFYNTESDIDRLAAALKKSTTIFCNN